MDTNGLYPQEPAKVSLCDRQKASSRCPNRCPAARSRLNRRWTPPACAWTPVCTAEDEDFDDFDEDDFDDDFDDDFEEDLDDDLDEDFDDLDEEELEEEGAGAGTGGGFGGEGKDPFPSVDEEIEEDFEE